MNKNCKHLVADSAAFIRFCDLRSIAEKIYTTREVVAEIRDKESRKRLQMLPYDLIFKNIDPKYLKAVYNVAKITGDYASLSVTDLNVLALTYQLQCEEDYDTMEGIDEVINEKVVQVGGSTLEEDLKLPGFYMSSSCKKNDDPVLPGASGEQIVVEEEVVVKEKVHEHQQENEDPEEDDGWTTQKSKKKQRKKAKIDIMKSESTNEEEFGRTLEVASSVIDDDDNEEGWITPEMMAQQMEDFTLDEDLKQVACLTSDFAMQNVMLKMKLNIMDVDGMLIKNPRTYILRCFTCFKTTTKMNKKFCPFCGNKTLKKIPIKVQEDGSIKMFFSRKPNILSTRGKLFNIPTFKGGKHANNPLLCEDQPMPQNRLPRKALSKTNVWSEDYDMNNPFASHDLHSRAFKQGVNKPNTRGRNATGRRRRT